MTYVEAAPLLDAVREAITADPLRGGQLSAETMAFIETTIAGSGERRAAIGAAQQATEAAAEFLRFADEGPASTRFPFEWDPVEKIAEATRTAATIERAYMVAVSDERERDVEGIAKLDRLIAACSAFMEGWA